MVFHDRWDGTEKLFSMLGIETLGLCLGTITLVPEVFLDFSRLRGLLLISFAKKNQEKPLGPG